ncbi:ATP-binding protein [Roseateles saccharophilus]|uniref:ATPase family protein associated with various cellular activities (AAA) n=1 Tax=Roseateles saccharophilus TaxID=304 RepID=A0A4R3U738_ROSSA|nr:ATP-binding protein [Roseateles saccharophilus]MDG0836176.1 ATP-binding protein [Roseateles saccharophilus]TCU81734.1 ATPase family protein associated with various cellular activities (AAA) [Roseateles saccharophilus]
MPKVNRIASRLEDLALPANSVAQLCNVATERVGTVILTAPSGTDKTHAAEVLARVMGCDLMHADLSHLVSPYIGETEKNLDRLFAAASASGAVLFFDEADALFGKRSVVKDSHDRYANAEVGYLLQKIEAYSGILILAAGVRQNLDSGFVRRLRNVVDLSWPPKSN